MNNLGRKQYAEVYNAVIIVLAIISILLVILDFTDVLDLGGPPWSFIDDGILGIFTIDYFTRLFLAKNKRKFFRENIFDLIAIIPINSALSFFRIARIGRIARLSKIIRLVRLTGFVGKLQRSLGRFFKTNGFVYLIWISLAILLLSATLYSFAESVPWSEALWWAIATATTVGYGDISPHTAIGKVAAILLMFVGIGFIGMLTSTITAYFAGEHETDDYQELSNRIEHLEQQNDELLKEIRKLKE